ncbi:MAG TPA: hypothetical protein GXX70_07495 [Tepidimicrobium sp.]|nr:hypothetical protein [Tepidimicrobium sp.]
MAWKRFDILDHVKCEGINDFIEVISQAMERSADVGVLAIRIGKMGLINSRYGFVFGDYVIRGVGLRIRHWKL